MRNFLIIGCGNAGIKAAVKIRQLNEKASVSVVTDENYPPYCRCLLTYFIENKVNKSFLFKDGIDLIKKYKINFIQNAKVNEINVDKSEVYLSNGDAICFDRLLIATGGEPLKPKLNFSKDLPVFTLRKFDDALKIRSVFKKGDTAVVEGGGLVSLKALLALYEIGVKIKWVIRSQYILSFVVDKYSADFIKSLILEKEGIEIYTEDSIIDILKSGDKIIVKTESGKEFKASGVIIGKGVSPNLLNFSENIKFDNGYLTNEFLETSLPNIYAAGDCNVVYDISHEKNWKVPLWPLAGEQGIIAAENMVRGNYIKYTNAVPVNSFSVFENNIVAGGKKKVEEKEQKFFHEKVFFNKDKKILKKYIYKKDRLKGFVLINDILDSGKFYWKIKNSN